MLITSYLDCNLDFSKVKERKRERERKGGDRRIVNFNTSIRLPGSVIIV